VWLESWKQNSSPREQFTYPRVYTKTQDAIFIVNIEVKCLNRDRMLCSSSVFMPQFVAVAGQLEGGSSVSLLNCSEASVY